MVSEDAGGFISGYGVYIIPIHQIGFYNEKCLFVIKAYLMQRSYTLHTDNTSHQR